MGVWKYVPPHNPELISTLILLSRIGQVFRTGVIDVVRIRFLRIWLDSEANLHFWSQR